MLQRTTLYINHCEHNYLSSYNKFLEVELPGHRVKKKTIKIFEKIWQIAYSKFLPIYTLPAVDKVCHFPKTLPTLL